VRHLLALASLGTALLAAAAAGAGAEARLPTTPPAAIMACAEAWDGRPEAPPVLDCAPPADTGHTP
jgi:hypothetical protein